MSIKIALVTGAAGGLGFTAVEYLIDKGFKIISIDNNFRKAFFGEDGSVDGKFDFLENNTNFYEVDICESSAIEQIFERYKDNIKIICHFAAQPSHDWAAKNPRLDFDINARGTLNLLEAARKHCPSSPFIFSSTNKVYGDKPNFISLKENKARYEYADGHFEKGIDENMSIDQSTHSVFGASKVAADVMVQEYGRYFNMPTVCFRAGCLTGASHSGAELHGYLQYIVKCAVTNKPYSIFGYKGKQVRDQIDFYDVVAAMYEFYLNPKPGAVYNIGGGYENSISILETIEKLNNFGYKLEYSYVEKERTGDHIVYYTDMAKFKTDYPNWKITRNIDTIIQNIIEGIEK
tara:strand:+ start:1299 stop:2342 length:1044 start_codon:yes stop_codon:yes gene_type:complete